MSIIAWIILGALAGWIASLIMQTDAEQGAVMNVVVGIAGAIVGGMLFRLFGADAASGLNLYSLLVAVVGATVLLFIYKAFSGRNARI